MEIIYELDEIESAAKQFLNLAKDFRISAFSGDLGAGKTTFISRLCQLMGVVETVSSPTYSIIQEYRTKDTNEIIYHIDLYRINDEEEARNAGIEDSLLSGEICWVEWPEKVPSIFPEKTVYAHLKTISSNKRKLIVELPS